MRIQPYRFYILIGVSALLSAWLADFTEKEEETITVATQGGADYFSSGYSKTEMNEAGIPKSDLIADSMTHYSPDDTVHLEKPVMTLYNKTVSPWIIRSETGILSADGDRLQLNGKVHINREASKGVSPLTVNTSNLRVRLPDNYAETDEWAEIISPPNRTTGVGMKTTFVEPIHLRLLARVKGRYEVN